MIAQLSLHKKCQKGNNMGALTEISQLFIHTFFYLAIVIVILRFLLQIAKADFYNPISQGLVKLTQPILKPMRRVIPGVFGLDMSSLILAFCLSAVAIILLLITGGYQMIPILYIIAWAILGCLHIIINIYFYAIIIFVILSWVAPSSYHPAALLIGQLVNPVLTPFRKLIPPIGGLDISVIVVFLGFNVLQILLKHLGALVAANPHFIIGM